MLQSPTNLPDNELLARARKLKDEEAAGILLERYSHLLAAVSLPHLDNYGNTPEEFFPSLIQRLFSSLQTQTIPKIGEWMQFFVKSQGNRTERNAFFFPSSALRNTTRLEYKVEKANSNILQKKQLAEAMMEALDYHLHFSRFQGENLVKNLEKVEVLKEMAGHKGMTPAQLAIAWVNAQGAHIMPLVSMSKRSRLPENIQAMEMTFTPEEMTILNTTFAQGQILGGTYLQR